MFVLNAICLFSRIILTLILSIWKWQGKKICYQLTQSPVVCNSQELGTQPWSPTWGGANPSIYRLLLSRVLSSRVLKWGLQLEPKPRLPMMVCGATGIAFNWNTDCCSSTTMLSYLRSALLLNSYAMPRRLYVVGILQWKMQCFKFLFNNPRAGKLQPMGQNQPCSFSDTLSTVVSFPIIAAITFAGVAYNFKIHTVLLFTEHVCWIPRNNQSLSTDAW